MKFLNHLWSRSHSGYTRLVKPNSILRSGKFQYFLSLLGRYFFLSTYCAPYALLPVTLLYLNDFGVVPSIVHVIIITILFLGVLYQGQDMLLYHPSMPETSRIYVPAPPPSLPYEEVNFETADKMKIHGYFLKQNEEKLSIAPTFVYFHGNAGNCGSPSILPLYFGCSANILMIDYRGFGRSAGIPSEEGLYLDGEGAVQYLHTRTDVDLNKIVLYGHSLGGAVAIHLASRSQWVKGRIAGIVVENTFTDIPTTGSYIFKKVMPFLGYLPHMLFKNRYESISKVGDIQVPMLFLYGDQDEIVPTSMARMLYESAGNPRSAIVELPNGTHNDTWCVSPLYQLSVALFLQKVFERPTVGSHSWQTPESSEERTSLSWEWQQHINSTRNR